MVDAGRDTARACSTEIHFYSPSSNLFGDQFMQRGPAPAGRVVAFGSRSRSKGALARRRAFHSRPMMIFGVHPAAVARQPDLALEAASHLVAWPTASGGSPSL